MIAEACLASGLSPEAFGVPSSAELGLEILDVLADQGKEQRNRALLADLRSRR